MKNVVLAVIVSVFMFSCDSKIPANRKLEEPYIVKSINSFYQDTVVCVYHLSTGVEYWNYTDNVPVVDSIGKFAIGDSVMFILDKR